jgi:hypothetical protein
VTDAPWELATGADLAVPGVEGRRTPKTRLAGAYVARLQAAAAHDPALARAFVRVTGLVDPPEALLRPAIALRVLRPGRGGPLIRAAGPPATAGRRPRTSMGWRRAPSAKAIWPRRRRTARRR